jgi:hypothetical protein
LYKYTLYGLHVESELPLPEVQVGDFDESDVIIRQGSIPQPSFSTGRQHVFEYGPEESVYYMKNIGGVIVRSGVEIVADALPNSEEKGFRFILTGIALGLLFRQRGLYSFHASAVEIDGTAVGFVGVKGMGKSTLAAAFTRKGYNLVTDDLLVVDVKEDYVEALPSFSHLKLLPDALKFALGVDPESVPKIDPRYTKRTYSEASPIVRSPLQLSHIYVLQYTNNDGNNVGLPVIRNIDRQEAFLQLVANDYVLRINNRLVDLKTLNTHKKIHKNVNIKKLIRSKNIYSLFDVVKSVVKDVAK